MPPLVLDGQPLGERSVQALPHRPPWPLVRRPGELAAIRPASSSALARSSPVSTSRSSRPSSRASSAVSRRAVKIRSAARDQPSRRASSCVPPPAGITPTLTSGSPTTAVVVRDDQVAGQRQLEPAAQREAVHRRDGRDRQVQHRAVRRAGHRPLGPQLVVAEPVALLEVGADAEGASATALVRTTARTVGSAAISAQAAAQLDGQLGRDGVQRLRPVQADLGDVGLRVLDPDPHRLRRRHRRLPTRAAHRWRP